MEKGRRSLWIIKQFAVSPDMAGGTRQYDFAKALVESGYQVTILASSFSYLEHREMRLFTGESWKIENIDGVKFVWIRSFPYQGNDWRRIVNIFDFAWRMYRIGRKLPIRFRDISPPEAVLAFSVPLIAPLAAYLLARRFRAKFLMEAGDLWPQTLIDMGVLPERHPVTAALRALEKFLYRRAAKIITPLPMAADYITSLGIAREKVVLIPTGVDLSHYDNMEIPQRAGKPFIVMYIGAHGPANALDVVIESASLLQQSGHDELRFVLVGNGQEKSRLKARAEELGLENVEFRDPVPKAEVPQTLGEAAATVFILNDLPLYRYGISLNKAFDYLAAKKPLILAGNPVNNPVEETHCGPTVPPRDPQALAEAIIKLYQMSPEEREAMGRRGREYVEKHHDISVLVEKLIRCIEQ